MNVCLVTVDGTDYLIQEPHPFVKEFNRKFKSHKFGKAALRYEIGINILTGDIVYYYGPFPAGMNDLSIFQIRLEMLLAPGEKVVADKGYKGSFLVHTPLQAKNRAHSKAMNKARARHEANNRHLKEWGVLQKHFRHDRHKHHHCFQAVIAIIQLYYENGRPPFQVPEHSDPIQIPF